jgi:LmbE family N-acetylglucosaminyl deacetylase
MSERVLIVAAHPDDEVLGCGGTAARLVKEGHEVYTVILGEGITSRDDARQPEKRAEELAQLKQQTLDANKLLGVKDVFMFDFPDNRFDTVPLLDIVKVIEKIKTQVRPGILFTHFENDLNIDHQVVYRAVLTASRPLPGESVKELYSFEVLSSTEWRFPLSFSPDCFFDITETIDIKTAALEKYESELKEFPHPRSIKGMRLNAEQWGMKTGVSFAEAFKVVRLLR